MAPQTGISTKTSSFKAAQSKQKKLAILIAVMAAGAGAAFYKECVLSRQPYHTSILTGRMWVLELLHGNPHRIQEQLGMKKHVFQQLVRRLYLTTSANHTRYVELEEQVAIFLYIMVTNLSNRKVAECFQCSGDTISRFYLFICWYLAYSHFEYRCFNSILMAVTSQAFYKTYIQLPNLDTPLNTYIADNPEFFPFFEGALGALDGTHISARPPAQDHVRYRNRKSGVSQNVLAACTFDMHFCYILSGWEGSASDGGVFHDARVHDLEIPEGRYYLADAGYAICDALLVPFRGVRYHLREWEACGLRYVIVFGRVDMF